MEGYKLTLTVNPFNEYSGSYTSQTMEEIENTVRAILDDRIGYLNDDGERNYIIAREDWEP